jgi:hypothetical protein
MGINVQTLRFLLTAKRSGVSFENTMMIGRQNTYNSLPPKEAVAIFLEFGQFVGNDALQTPDGYVEPMLTRLGAIHIDSIDYSSFEGASVIHDMNLPIPDELKSRFSVVIDGGTLEHVFNFPQALKNAMEMVAVGGHFLAVTPCNNYMGHGFYQFSPELFFRAFSEENGFKLEDVFICRWPRGRWYRVSDPKVIGTRVELINNYPTSLFVQAKRLRKTEVFATTPQQSDYVAYWTGTTSPPSAPPGKSVRSFVKRIFPEFINRHIKNVMAVCRPATHFKITNKSAFQPIDLTPPRLYRKRADKG